MPKYFFNVSGGVAAPDNVGIVFADVDTARKHAEGLESALTERGPETTIPWRISVTDGNGEPLFEVPTPAM